MAITGIPIDENQCIGDSLSIINSAFSALDARTLTSGSGTVTNVTGTTPIIITGTPTTTPNVTLDAAFIARLTTLENNMNNIGNYPYLEYAWVCAPSDPSQTISANLSATLTLTTEIADTGNYGSINANQISLSAGTYQYEAKTTWSSYGNNPQGVFGLYNATDGKFISRSGNYVPAGNGGWNELNGQFTTSVDSKVYLILHQNVAVHIINSTYSNATQSSVNNTQLDQRTTIKLWKVG